MHNHDQTILARMLWCSTTTETMRAPAKAAIIRQVYFCALALCSNCRQPSSVAPSSVASFVVHPVQGEGMEISEDDHTQSTDRTQGHMSGMATEAAVVGAQPCAQCC